MKFTLCCHRRFVALLTVCTTLVSGCATVRTGDAAFASLARFQGKRIYVEERLGGVAIGRLTDVGPSSLTVTTPDRTRPIERSEITRVLRDGDSIKEGAILAAVGGVLLSLLDPFKGEHRCDSNCGWKWVAGVGMLAAAGGWLDYRVGGMTVVYQSTPVP